MAQTTVKEEIQKLVAQLPDDATWQDAADLITVHERLARARQERAAGKTVPLEEVEREFGFTG